MRNVSVPASDDPYDMNTREPSARDVDALFSMRSVESPADAAVQRALGEAKAALMREPNPSYVAFFGAQLATVAACAQSPSRPAESTRSARRGSHAPWTRRAVSTVAVALASGGLVAGAAAANEAAPGGVLYGVDQALERMGILDGGLGERFDEVQALLDGGQPEAALRHASDALTEGGYPDAAIALTDADGPGAPGVDPSEAEAFVAWLTSQDRGPGFGQEVAARARDLGTGVASGSGVTGGGGNGNGPAPQATQVPNPPQGGEGAQPGSGGSPAGGPAPQATQVPNPPQKAEGGKGGEPAPQATQVPNPPQGPKNP